MSLRSFDGFPQPQWNAADDIDRALEAVLVSDSEDESEAAYQRVLWAVGNDHGGTYFPVVLPAISVLGSILETGSPWAQRAAVEVSIDWYCAFVPEVGHETFAAESLKLTVKREIEALTPRVALLTQFDSAARRSAIELTKSFTSRT